MFSVRFVCLVLAAACLLCAGFPVLAAEVDCDATYCFTAQDFSLSEEPLAGICITGLPDSSTGTVLLGNRVIRTGDILTADEVVYASDDIYLKAELPIPPAKPSE